MLQFLMFFYGLAYNFGSSHGNSNPCVLKDKTLCDLRPTEECLFTVVYGLQQQKQINIVNVKVIGQFISIQWTHETEEHFLVRSIPVDSKTHPVHCIYGHLNEESIVNKILQLGKKIVQYSTLIPLERNVYSYIIDIGIKETRKETARNYVRIPTNLESNSPIVVVTPYQDWAEFTVFEQSKTLGVKHYYSIAECSSAGNWTNGRENYYNWNSTGCDISKSITHDEQMKPGVAVPMHLKERQTYQIWIDSVYIEDYDLLKTPVFGRPEQGKHLESIRKALDNDVTNNTKSESVSGPQLSAIVSITEDASDSNTPSLSLIVIVTVGSAVVLSISIVIVKIKLQRTGVNPGLCVQTCILMRDLRKSDIFSSQLQSSEKTADNLYDVKNMDNVYDVKKNESLYSAKDMDSFDDAEHENIFHVAEYGGSVCCVPTEIGHATFHTMETRTVLPDVQDTNEPNSDPSESMAPLLGNILHTDHMLSGHFYQGYIKEISDKNPDHRSNVIYNSTNTINLSDYDINTLTRSISQQLQPSIKKQDNYFVHMTKDSVIVHIPRSCTDTINAQVLEKATNTSVYFSSSEHLLNVPWSVIAPTDVDDRLTWSEIEEQLLAVNEN